MVFIAFKTINRLLKEIDRLLSKGMSNICLKVTIEKKWHTQNFDFVSLKNLFQFSFLEAPTHADITEFSKFLLQLKNQISGSKTLCGFSIIFILKGNMTF